MKVLKTYFFSVVMVALALISMLDLGAMKRKAPDSGFDDAVVTVKKQKNEPLECRPIVILIDHIGQDNGAMISELVKVIEYDREQKKPQAKPIMMLSPNLVSNFLKSSKNYLFCRKNDEKKWLEEFVFFNKIGTHFILMFPKIYKEYLPQDQTSTLTTFEQLETMIKTKDNHPSAKEFKMLSKFCEAIKNMPFKIFVSGHGTVESHYFFSSPNEKTSLICNLHPKDCSDMLQSFNHNKKIKVFALSSCSLGGANRYFFGREPNESSIPIMNSLYPWKPVTYSFDLVIKGITDNPCYNSNFIESFLNSKLVTTMTSKDITQELTTDEGIYTPETILQILPSGQSTFQIYKTTKNEFAIIDQNSIPSRIDQQLAHVIKESCVLIYKSVSEAIEFDPYQIVRLFFMAPDTHCYEFEKISLPNLGVIEFITTAFEASGSSEFLKKILIKQLEGPDDIGHYSKDGKRIVYSNDPITKKTILKNVRIVASSEMKDGQHEGKVTFTYDDDQSDDSGCIIS